MGDVWCDPNCSQFVMPPNVDRQITSFRHLISFRRRGVTGFILTILFPIVQLDLFFPFVGISSEPDFKAIAIGPFCDITPLLTTNENGILVFMGQKDMINREQRSAESQR
jgi:hypothetical protein